MERIADTPVQYVGTLLLHCSKSRLSMLPAAGSRQFPIAGAGLDVPAKPLAAAVENDGCWSVRPGARVRYLWFKLYYTPKRCNSNYHVKLSITNKAIISSANNQHGALGVQLQQVFSVDLLIFARCQAQLFARARQIIVHLTDPEGHNIAALALRHARSLTERCPI